MCHKKNTWGKNHYFNQKVSAPAIDYRTGVSELSKWPAVQIPSFSFYLHWTWISSIIIFFLISLGQPEL